MDALAIVVPVYNGAADVERCLGSLARHRPARSTIVLVDDASSDPAIAPMLEAFAGANPGVRVISAKENRGFVKSANAGAAAAPGGADILFLNTDTEVTEGWAEEMIDALARHPSAVVCCPFSNNATYLSLPKYQQENELPFGWSAQRMATLVRECAGELRVVQGPTPVGFCMLVRRTAWQTWGPFDEAYGLGYGEDDDFGQRVQAAGGAIVCAPRAFVYHRGGASFAATPQLAERRRVNGALLESKWPGYFARTKAWCQDNPLRPLHERIWQALLAPATPAPVHVLHVIERWELAGPLRAQMLETVQATRDFALHTILVPMPDRGAWLDAIDFEFEPGMRVVGLIDFERSFAKFLAASPANLVHFRGPEDWVPDALIEMARKERAVLVSPGEVADVARCAQAYRRVAEVAREGG